MWKKFLAPAWLAPSVDIMWGVNQYRKDFSLLMPLIQMDKCFKSVGGGREGRGGDSNGEESEENEGK